MKPGICWELKYVLKSGNKRIKSICVTKAILTRSYISKLYLIYAEKSNIIVDERISTIIVEYGIIVYQYIHSSCPRAISTNIGLSRLTIIKYWQNSLQFQRPVQTYLFDTQLSPETQPKVHIWPSKMLYGSLLVKTDTDHRSFFWPAIHLRYQSYEDIHGIVP
jgi:hypothetical protein